MTAPSTDHDRVYASWVKWIEVIKTEIIRAHWHQAVWSDVRDEIQRLYPDADASFLVSYSQLYARAQLVRIRALTDADSDAASLRRLIAAIRNNSAVLHFDRYVAVRGDPVEARYDWLRCYGDEEGRLRLALLDGDTERLDDLKPIKAHVDENIAHIQRSVHVGDDTHPTVQADRTVLRFQDIRDALAVLGEVCNTYLALLTGSMIGDWSPIIEPDWHEPLRRGLFLPGDET